MGDDTAMRSFPSGIACTAAPGWATDRAQHSTAVPGRSRLSGRPGGCLVGPPGDGQNDRQTNGNRPGQDTGSTPSQEPLPFGVSQVQEVDVGIQRQPERELNPRQVAAFGWICIVLGSLAVICGVVWGIRSLALLVGGEQTAGTVVEVREELPSESTIRQRMSEGESRHEASKPEFVPVVEYEVDGEKYRIEHAVVSRNRSLVSEVGQTVEVLYKADRPAEGGVNSFFALWGGPLLFAAVGSIFAALGIFNLRRRRQRA